MRIRRAIVFCVAISFSILVVACAIAAEDKDLRVMTYNIRYGTAKDGENHWDKRKEFLVDVINKFEPDLLGTQETLGFQRDFLAEKLPNYGSVGVGRDDGREAGEMMALFYKLDRFRKVDEGHFWFSETPDLAGSKGWDTSLPRMVTWVKLEDKQNGNEQLMFFNTHFDHRGPKARLESAKLLRQKIAELSNGCAAILTGDLNSAEGSEPYKALFGELDAVGSPVVDCYRKVHPERGANEGTTTAFKPTANNNSRIDFIACSPQWQVVSAEIDHAAKDERAPSDHFPIEVVLRR
jgi:endonuclease/exonuclease/phosphatase family metal-dependent hydrolase